MKKIYTTLLSLFIIANLTAQEIHRCFTTEYVDHLSQTNPNIKQNIKNSFDAAKEYSQSQITLKSTIPTTIYRIPVVFHVVYNSNAENISDSLLFSQIDVLNRDYRKLNADTTNYRPVFKDRASDVGFEFFLATIDPDENLTTGITRTQTSVSGFGGLFPNPAQLDEVKSASTNGKDAWNTDTYLNIWVCNTGGSVLGYAYPPTIAPNWPAGSTPSDKSKWGVVISHEVIGFNNPLAVGALSIADQGRTGVHEVGHYFGLRHIWGDAGSFFPPGPDCDITKDDGIDDTPHMGENSQTAGCDFFKNSCTNGETPDEPDMPENYMDYSEETCQNMFTQGQADLMQAMAITGRPDLAEIITSENLIVEPGDYIVVNGTDTILIDPTTYVTILAGDEITFLNENNGYSYTASNNGFLNGSDDYSVTANGEITVSEPSNINQISVSNQFVSIFPNPSHSTIKLSNNSEFSITKVLITNVEGKRFFIENISTPNDLNIDLSNFDSGLYFISIYDGEKLFSVKKLSVIK